MKLVKVLTLGLFVTAFLAPARPARAQTGTITGTVTDSTTGETLPGVNVVIEGTTQGAATDAEGHYTIPSVEPGTYTLVATFIGYADEVVESVEVVEGEATTIDFRLEPGALGLDEVVVVGYGTQREVEITGAVASIDGAELTQVPSTNITNSLSGRVPGLIVMDRSGVPGSGSNLSIRGASTFGDNSALIVVDGIVRQSFEYIDPHSIESISILKDASAAAVYGSRAANGVILVTTKRGHSGKPVFDYNSFVGVQQPTVYPRLLNAYEFASTRNKALENEGQPPYSYYSEDVIGDLKEGQLPTTDWYNQTLKQYSFETRQNLNVSGGSDAIKYFLSAGYVNEQGMYDMINFQNYSLRSNVDAIITEHLTISANLYISKQDHNGSSYAPSTIFADIIGANPLDVPYNEDGTIAYQNEAHPIEEAKTGYNYRNSNTTNTTLKIEQDIPFIKGLTAVGKVSFGKESSNAKEYMMPIRMHKKDADGNTIEIYSTFGYNGETALQESFYNYNTTTLVARLNYKRAFGDHDVEAFALFEQFEAHSKNFNAFRTNFPADGLDELFFGGEDEDDNGGSSFEAARRSFVGRLNYGYKHRYLFQATLRIDGSVAFPSSNRYGFFPAVSAGWRISEESFMKNSAGLSFIDRLKLRASFGILGNDRNVYNDRVPTFQFRQVYYPSGTVILGDNPLPTISPGVLANTDITWETAYNYDVGIDGSLWEGKLQFELGAFYKRTTNILRPRIRAIPATFGAALPASNYAVVDNRGIEFSFTHNNDAGTLEYFISINGGFFENEVIRIDEAANIPNYLRQTGRPLGFIIGYKALGYFQSDEEVEEHYPQFSGGQQAGDVKYADVNGDHQIDANDRTIISMNNNTPDIVGGLSFGGSYKGFDLNLLFQGGAQMVRMLSLEARTYFMNGSRNTFAPLLDYWTPQNRDATYPRPTVSFHPNNSKPSTLYLRDTKYIRLKSVSLGYTIPNELVGPLGVNNMRIYISGYNLFHIDSSMNMFDPESWNPRGTYYPQQRSLRAGLHLSF